MYLFINFALKNLIGILKGFLILLCKNQSNYLAQNFPNITEHLSATKSKMKPPSLPTSKKPFFNMGSEWRIIIFF